jgi:hypothetical protein
MQGGVMTTRYELRRAMVEMDYTGGEVLIDTEPGRAA